MPKVRIEAMQTVRYSKVVEMDEDELEDLRLNATDPHVDIADVMLTRSDADFGNGLESVEISVGE